MFGGIILTYYTPNSWLAFHFHISTYTFNSGILKNIFQPHVSVQQVPQTCPEISWTTAAV